MNNEPFESPSIKSHRKQRFWQIIFPIILISLLVISFGSYFISKGGSQTRVWADISIIWMALPLLMVLLFSLAILVGLIILTVMAAQKVPLVTRKLQRLFCILENKSVDATDTIIKPIFWVGQIQAGIASLFKKIIR